MNRNRLLAAMLCAVLGLTVLCGCGDQPPASSTESLPATSSAATTLPAITIPALSELSQDAPQDLLDYREKNDDVKGLLQIPALDIRLPVVQAEDNDYYLRRGLNKKYAYMGTLYFDYRNDTDDVFDNNTIIYGHNVGKRKYDDRMFGRLVKYRERETFKEAAIIKYTALNGYTYYYQVFSVYSFPGKSGGDPYFSIITDFAENTAYNVTDMRRYEAWNTFLSVQQERSELFAAVPLSYDDKILNLVTCVYDKDDYRLSIMAKEMSLEEITEYRAANPDDVAFANYSSEKIGNRPDYYLQHMPGSLYPQYGEASAPTVPQN